jgi:cytochrome oxidase Cu insertion factor (SCO1/SenC/PrrC family)
MGAIKMVRTGVVVLIISIAYAGTVFSQTTTQQSETQDASKPKTEDTKKKQVVEFADTYNRRFAKRKPLIGEILADVKAWDEYGKEFDLSSTRGKYTVIVFGCLT